MQKGQIRSFSWSVFSRIRTTKKLRITISIDSFTLFLYIFSGLTGNPAYIYLFKVNNRNTRKRWEISSKLTIKTPERHHWRRSGFFIVNFEHISHLFQVFLLLTLNKEMLAGNLIKFHKFLLICQRST